MWEYTHTDELYHYGVKGMKWGKRKARKLEKKYARAGRNLGMAEYYRDQANKTVRNHEKMATALDKQAKTYDKAGSALKAEAARRAAGAIRQRGQNASQSSEYYAAKYEKKAAKITEKASTYATKKRVDLGKDRIDAILKENKTKGYDREKRADEFQRELAMEERLGDRGYDAYNRLRGRS